MLKEKLIGFLLFGYTLFCNCMTEPARSGFDKNRGAYKVDAYARMPKGFYESSGLIPGPGGAFWTMQDSGNPAALYLLRPDGALVDSLKLPVKNIDWESLARDAQGNIYIGDFGNNANTRRNLRVFRLEPGTQQLDTIHFTYPDQQEFPPPPKEMNFDCEAFVWHQNRLHLFSKSYGSKIVKHYSLPDSAGSYEATLEEELKLKGLITGAALRPDGRELALLAYGSIYLFQLQEGGSPLFLEQPYKCISLAGRAQTEAISYVNEENLLLTNEQGRLVYVYKNKKE